jgi:hypothetical protein
MGALWTDPECRGQGLASLVMGKASEVIHDKGFTIGGAFTNPISARICRKLGFTLPNRVSRLLLLKTVRPYLKHHIRLPGLGYLLDLFYRSALKSYRFFACSSRAVSGLKITAVDPSSLTDPANVEFFDGLAHGDLWHFNDRANKMAWKLSKTKNCTLYFVSEENAKLPFMYLIVKDRHIRHLFAERYTDFSLMTLMDFGMTSLATRNYVHLLSVIEHLFGESDAEILETVTSSPVLVRRARLRGHLKVGKGVTYLFRTLTHLDLPSEAANIDTWNITHFCSDGFSFL